MILEGKNAVLEALRAAMPLERIFVAAGTKPDRALTEIERRAREQHIPLDQVPRKELDARSERGAHQGVLALSAPFPFTELTTIIKSSAPAPHALVIVCDHITDPGNFGAIARTAEVVGAAGIVTASRRSASITPAAHKAAAGAFAHVLVARVVNITRALEELQAAGYWVAGASEHARQVAWDAALTGKIALVMGSEGDGLSRLVRERCDFLIKLPQAGKVGSLNVAQATTALAYEWLRQNTESTG